MKKPDPVNFLFDKPENSPGYILAQLTLVWQRKQKKVLDPLDLTQTQFVLLSSIAWLMKTSDPVTQVDIAHLNNFDRMMVSKVLRTLQSKQLIIRQEHATDTRAKIVQLTPAGQQLLQKALTAVEKADIEFFSAIGENLSALNNTMQQLIDANRGE